MKPSQFSRDTLKLNCARLGFPVPALAWCAQFANIPTGSPTNFATHGDQTNHQVALDGDFCTYVEGPNGPALRLDSDALTANRAQLIGATVGSLAVRDITVFAVITPQLQSANRNIVFIGYTDALGNNRNWWLGGNNHASGTDYKPRWCMTSASGTNFTSIQDANQYAVGERLVLCGVRDYDETRLYRAGQLVASGACSTDSLLNPTDATPIEIGGVADVGIYNAQADYEVIMIWGNKALSADQIRMLSDDPYLLWREWDDEVYNHPHDFFPAVTVTQTLLLTSLVALPHGTEFTASSTLSRMGLGGKQVCRLGSRIYTPAISAVATFVLYSDDQGETWTSEQVVANAGSSAHLVQGAGSQPALLLRRDQTLYLYLRTSGGGWDLKSTFLTGNDANGFWLGYDSTNYHLIFNHSMEGDDDELRYYSSTDLVSWSVATLLDTPSGDAYAPEDARSLAACMDSAGDIHLAYCMGDGTDFLLKYNKRTAGTWGTAATIENLGDQYNDQNRAFHLSMVTDKNVKPHLFGCRYYTGTVNVFYRNKTGSSWTSDERIYATASHEFAPSAGMRDRLYPNCVFYGSLSDGRVHFMQRDGSNLWTRDVLSTSSSAASPEQAYDPYRKSSYTLQGSFVVFQSSVLVFVSTQLVWGDGGASSGDAAFSHSIKLYGRDGVRQTATFTSVVNDPGFDRRQSVTSLLPFNQVVSTGNARPRGAVHGPRFSQDIGCFTDPASGNNTILVGVTHTINIGSYFNGSGKVKSKTVTHALAFTATAGLNYNQSATSGLAFTQSLVGRGIRNKSVAQNLLLASVVAVNKILNKVVTSAASFGSSAVRVRAWVWNSTHFDPGWAAEYESQVGDFVILGPDEAPTISMTLPKPDFDDDVRVFRRDQAVRRNRSGQARTFVTPVYKEFRYGWSGLLRKRAEEFRQAATPLLGKTVRIRDHNGVTYRCVITGPDIMSSQKGPEFCNVAIVFEVTEAIA